MQFITEMFGAVNSLYDWVFDLDARFSATAPLAWSAPAWTGAVNVTGTPTHVEASYTDEGDYIDVEGAFIATPTASSVACIVSESIGVAFAHPDVDKPGFASAADSSNVLALAGCQVATKAAEPSR